MRAMEAILGIGSLLDIDVSATLAASNVTAAISAAASNSTLSGEVLTALAQSVPILVELATELDFSLLGIELSSQQKEPLVAK